MARACAATAPCPCGRLDERKRARTFGACCGRWLEGDALAPDAESLMRSRYSAFVLERAPYLLATWHSTTRPNAVEFEPGVKWLGLEVRAHRRTGDTTAEVEFVVRLKPISGPAVRQHERSRFVCEAGRWLYLDGDAL